MTEQLTEAQRYRAFRNFMFNELGVTKNDIRQWITEAVQEQVRQVSMEARVEKAVERELHSSVKEAIRIALGSPNYGRNSPVVERVVAEAIKGRIKITMDEE